MGGYDAACCSGGGGLVNVVVGMVHASANASRMIELAQQLCAHLRAVHQRLFRVGLQGNILIEGYTYSGKHLFRASCVCNTSRMP